MADEQNEDAMKTFKLVGVRADYDWGAIIATVATADEPIEVHMPIELLSHVSFLHGNYPRQLPPMGAQVSDDTDRPDDGA